MPRFDFDEIQADIGFPALPKVQVLAEGPLAPEPETTAPRIGLGYLALVENWRHPKLVKAAATGLGFVAGSATVIGLRHHFSRA